MQGDRRWGEEVSALRILALVVLSLASAACASPGPGAEPDAGCSNEVDRVACGRFVVEYAHPEEVGPSTYDATVSAIEPGGEVMVEVSGTDRAFPCMVIWTPAAEKGTWALDWMVYTDEKVEPAPYIGAVCPAVGLKGPQTYELPATIEPGGEVLLCAPTSKVGQRGAKGQVAEQELVDVPCMRLAVR